MSSTSSSSTTYLNAIVVELSFTCQFSHSGREFRELTIIWNMQVEVVLQQVKSGRRVLACAASNAAVDNLALALLTADPSIPLARAGVTGL